MTEIIVRFKDQETQDKFIGQMMDGFGEGLSDFTHWHKEDGEYTKQYCPEGRLICTVNEIFEDNF
jgi:hypothetical protein